VCRHSHRDRRSAVLQDLSRECRRSPVGKAAAGHAAGRHRGGLPGAPVDVVLRQRLLCCRVQIGYRELEAWLFGSLDSANSITVDKPPASLWIMVLSCRIFGFSSFSMLFPQALMGVGTEALLYGAVRRTSGPATGPVAGALVALTPVAALMLRFNNPDAMLVLLMTAGGYFVVQSLEKPAEGQKSHALRWLLLAGTAIGFAFLAKMLQGLLVLPAFGLVYLVAGDKRLVTRLWHLLAAAGAVVVSAGWFVVLVALWPAGSRPYIGGSTDNSLWQLAIGYNGLGRLFGASGNGGTDLGGGGMGGTSFGGASGLTRMFGTAFGSQISWLLPAALAALVAGLWFSRRAPRTNKSEPAFCSGVVGLSSLLPCCHTCRARCIPTMPWRLPRRSPDQPRLRAESCGTAATSMLLAASCL